MDRPWQGDKTGRAGRSARLPGGSVDGKGMRGSVGQGGWGERRSEEAGGEARIGGGGGEGSRSADRGCADWGRRSPKRGSGSADRGSADRGGGREARTGDRGRVDRGGGSPGARSATASA